MDGFFITVHQSIKYRLSDHEKEFLDLYGKIFELRRSYNFGRIFALFMLRARSAENGLDQQEIVNFFNTNFPKNSLSISTVSRILAKMEQGRYCDSIPGKGRKRKYFAKMKFSQLTIERITYNIKEGEELIKNLQKLKESLPPEDKSNNPAFIEVLENLEQVYAIITDYYRESLESVVNKLTKIDS